MLTSLQHAVLLDLALTLVVDVRRVGVLSEHVWQEAVLQQVLSLVEEDVGAVCVDGALVEFLEIQICYCETNRVQWLHSLTLHMLSL